MSPARQPRILADRLGRWRDLRLPVKLGLVTLVPMLVMVALGVVVIEGQVANAGQYARADRTAQLSATVRVAISALQDEREQVATGAADGHPPQSLTGTRHQADQTLAALHDAVNSGNADGDLDPVALDAWSTADRELATLPALRVATRDPTATGSSNVATYTDLIDSLFAFDRVLTTGLSDATLTREALSLYDLFAAREEVRYEQSVVLAGMGRRTMSVSDVTSLHGSEARLGSRISDFHAVASQVFAQEYDRAVGPAAMMRQNVLLGQAIDQSGGMTGDVMPGMMINVPMSTWDAANHTVTVGMDGVTDDLAAALRSGAQSLRSAANRAAIVAIAGLLIALAVTAALAAAIARQLVRSIGELRRTAMDVAGRRLPEAVELITAGESVDVTVAPVGVATRDEIGQLARAFDAVHAEALRLAVAQANLRANYSELFVNLSRRSQTLVQRQLRLIEQLERDEEDPDQLATLFKLDHLATRMRRNNENLMVLSGGELTRNTNQQVSLADLLRGAVSEIEQYQRVTVQPPPEAYVVGYAAGDLVRLLAELLDNATAYSAPDTTVTVASHLTRARSVVIDIVDHGIGMNDEEVVRANDQLAQPAGVEGRISRRMGLFVISRLAHQHDVRVRLHGGHDIPGLRVTITVPPDLVVGEPEALTPLRSFEDGDSALPKRRAGATTATNGAWQEAMRGTLDIVGEIATDIGAPHGDSGANAMTVTIPVLPSAEASGVGLFEPLSDEDGAEQHGEDGVADGGEAARDPGVTPIFDTMLSAWFEDAPEPEGPIGWRFAADEGWHAVDAVAEIEPVEFTAAGLPKRQPRALLVPGSVPDEPGYEVTVGPAEAERLRDRMSGFQDGLRRGRTSEPEPGPPEPIPAAEWSLPVADDVPAEVTPAGLPKRQPRRQASPATAEQAGSALFPADWPSSADEGWRAADDLVAPAEVTLAGLPKRQPRAHLLPGSVPPPASDSGGRRRHAAVAVNERDPGALRDRLSSFQRGVQEGRGGADSDVMAPADHGFHW